ncbi:hypothetical protein A1O3_07936 [Capronia epimyces CBS 606.96]|uniref:Nuclear distribution protein RO10 n=1 Tax=Capronia epimyces CBS 606.96 TaxID=1182542 RepID=W9XRN3_9EURO|nr:uncharacterized protein A1O3_07936 [Capronia epimyces CBS 606.96]EXJ79656.1 hypothetical protein A1O3_07936 [Capronia epimyces CBS 606.96]
MATDTSDPEAAAHGTLALLTTRLDRLEFLLSGKSNEEGRPESITAPTHNNETIWAQLDSLEAKLCQLKKLTGPAGEVVRNVERLSSTYPDLFSPQTSTSEIPESEDLSTLASIVLSHATLFPETASRLSSLQTLQVPSAEQSSKLVSLIPRLAQCKENEQSLEEDIQELRERSARCLEWWVKVGVIGTGDLYENWERRLHEVERHLIRSERRAKEEQGYL